MFLRPIQEQDRAEVLEMMTEFYSTPALLSPAPREILNKDIDDCLSDLPFVDGHVIALDGNIAGYTMVSKGYSTERGGISIMIEDLYIKQEYRGNGLGGKVLSELEEIYKTAVRMRLEVSPSNDGAARLYGKVGYERLPYIQMVKELKDL